MEVVWKDLTENEYNKLLILIGCSRSASVNVHHV